MKRTLLFAAALGLAWAAPTQAQDMPANKLSNGGFEADAPAYWTPSGDGATWATDKARSPNYSLKLSGAGEASWSQEEVVRNWVSAFGANEDLVVGAYVWADGVNVNPGDDASKFQFVASFRDADGNDVLGQDVVVDVPQDAASTGGWVKISSADVAAISLPNDATSVTFTVRKGASATGTVYVDDFFVNGTGGVFNATVDAPAAWYYYAPGAGSGDADWPEKQPFFLTRTDAETHSGDAALLIEQNVADTYESVAITERVPVQAGQPVLISYWLKTEGNEDPATIGEGDNNVGLTALFYNQMESGAAGYGEIGGLDIRLNGLYNPQVIPLLPRQADNGWTQYAFVVYPFQDAVGMEVRLRYWNAFTGATYWDDVYIGDVEDVSGALTNLVSAPGFEADSPSYWVADGDGAEWSTEQARSPNYSLKLSGAGVASWSQQLVRNWVSGFGANEDLVLGAYVWMDGVNTSPADDAGKFQMVATFRDADGADVLGQPVVVDLPQDAASTGGWVKVSSADVGAISLPKMATDVDLSFRKGASATGTVYVDDVFVTGTGGVFNATVDSPGGWYYYAPDAGSGAADWPEQQPFFLTKTTEEAHTGDASLLIEQNVADTYESVAITERLEATPGQPMLVSFWLKTEGNESPETIGEGDNNVGLTALWYNNLTAGADGYGEIGGADIRLNGEYNSAVIPLQPRTADNGWTNYAFVLNPLPGTEEAPTVGMELRLRYWNAWTGKTYWDDVSISNISGDALTVFVAGEDGPEEPGRASATWLRANAPNPFTRSTEVRFVLPEPSDVTLEVYDMLGRRVALLVDGEAMPAQEHAVDFQADDLSAGNYLVVLRTPSHAEARTITVVR